MPFNLLRQKQKKDRLLSDVCRGMILLLCWIVPPSLQAQTPPETTYLGAYHDLKIPFEPIPDTLEEIGVLFHETPNVSLVGFLVAQEEGYYKTVGLPPINFHWPSERTSGIREHRLGHVRFSTVWMTRSYHYNALGSGMVAIARIGNGSLGILTHKDLHPDIRALKDFSGYSIGVNYRNEENIQILLKVLGIDATLIPHSGDGTILLHKGAVDGLCYTDYQIGADSRFSKYRKFYYYLPLHETKIDLPELCVNVHRSFLLKYPVYCRDFMLATWRGWAEAYRNPEKALATLKKYYIAQSLVYNERIVQAQWKEWTSLLTLFPNAAYNGMFSRSEFDNMRALMIRAKLVRPEDAATYEDFFYPVTLPETMRRIEKLNRETESKGG